MAAFYFFISFLEGIGSFYNSLVAFLSYTIEFGGLSFSVWQITLGGGLVVLVIASIIKSVTPLL